MSDNKIIELSDTNWEKAVEKARVDSESEPWDDVKADVKSIKGLLSELENSWNERERQFKPVGL